MLFLSLSLKFGSGGQNLGKRNQVYQETWWVSRVSHGTDLPSPSQRSSHCFWWLVASLWLCYWTGLVKYWASESISHNKNIRNWALWIPLRLHLIDYTCQISPEGCRARARPSEGGLGDKWYDKYLESRVGTFSLLWTFFGGVIPTDLNRFLQFPMWPASLGLGRHRFL